MFPVGWEIPISVVRRIAKWQNASGDRATTERRRWCWSGSSPPPFPVAASPPVVGGIVAGSAQCGESTLTFGNGIPFPFPQWPLSEFTASAPDRRWPAACRLDTQCVTNSQFMGANAPYAVPDGAMIARKPRRLTHVEAASVPSWQVRHGRGSYPR